MPKIQTEVINGVRYQNVFGLLDRVKSEEEIATLDPTQQYLERVGKELIEEINQRAEAEEKGKKRRRSK